ncbi:hypothetical protein C1H46_038911 [Malus baccata]|uniref:Uncharacterized protein n=1 Tax=Malus baccata TaxID=106549 RepID=A0A540KMX6_MALBA|nr:hypothetical protein C1H46_038911 [Malus baccata]
MRDELKAETLLTNLLREKLYSKELEVEQLQAEVAAAVRGNDILRGEVQNAMDNLEMLMLKKGENINQLQSDLQASTKELTVTRGILPKTSEERYMMWEEVKKYNEKNMLLNSEEGQITTLKDTIERNKPFDPPEGKREENEVKKMGASTSREPVAKLAASSLMEVFWAAATRIDLAAMFESPAMVTRAAGTNRSAVSEEGTDAIIT